MIKIKKYKTLCLNTRGIKKEAMHNWLARIWIFSSKIGVIEKC